MKAEKQPSITLASKLVPSSVEEGGLQLGQLVGAIRRKALLIIGITTVVVGLAQLKALTDKPVYSGSFEILTKSVTVESEVISSVPQTLTSRQQETTTTTTILDETKIRVLRSPSLLYPILEQLKPNHPEIDYSRLVGNLDIQTTGGDILTVSYFDEDPKLVQDVLNVVSRAYLNYSLEERQKDVRQGIDFVEEQLPQLESRVSTQQEKLQRFRQTYNLIDPEMQATQLSDQAGVLAQQQVEIQTQLAAARLLYGQLRNELAYESTESATTSALSDSPRYQKLLDQLLEIDSKLAENSALYLEGSLEVQVLQEQRQNLLPLLQREGLRVGGGVASNIEELENQSQAVSQSMGELNQRIRQLSVITRQYTDIQRELQIATDNLNQFLAKREGLRIDAAQRQVPWQLLTPPVDPQPSSASLKRSSVLGAILGLLMGVGAALVVDKLSNVIHTSKEVKDITKLPLLGVIPFNRYLRDIKTSGETMSRLQSAGIKLADDRPFLHQAEVSFLEAFRSLSANIRMSSPDMPIRSLIISSATPNNGKTTIAIHLAQVAAEMGQRVLLIDTDLRRPALHHRLGLSDSPGLTEVVSANLDFLTVVQQVSWESNLFVMTAGTIPPDPSRILSSQSMKNFISKSQEAFDLVIFDTPPLLGLADIYLLADSTDGILLAVRLHQLKRSLLEQVMEELRVATVPVLGVVANASEDRSIASYNYYYSPSQQLQRSQNLVSKFKERIGR